MADMDPEVLFKTQRTALIEKYTKAQQEFKASTKPYKSTLQLVGTASANSNASVSFIVFLAGQQLEWFSYKVGEAIPYGPGAATRKALEDDTNLSKARQTNGIEDFCIESISMTCRSRRVNYTTFVSAPLVLTDPNVSAATKGLASLVDPASIVAPPQVMSPFNLEDLMLEAIKPHLAIEFEWDRRYVEKIGTADQIPEGGAKSFLRASGNPETSNRYRIPEGYLWRREGEPDSEFIVRGTLVENVVIPVNNITFPLAAEPSLVTNVFLDLVVRLHGLSVSIPTRN